MKFLGIFIGLLNFIHAQEWHDKWSKSGNTWVEKWSNTLDGVNQFEPGTQIEILTAALGVADKGGLKEEEKPIFYRAQSMLLAIPGHATYYQDKIESMRSDVLANSKKTMEEMVKLQNDGIEWVDESVYESYCGVVLRKLRYIPSPETVSVLGYYLNDPVGRDGKTLLGKNRSRPGDDFGPRNCNAEQAAMSIRELGIDRPPFPVAEGRAKAGLREGEIDAWKDWWNEVKDGKRTYRFIGSKIEYGPDGPASQEVIQRVERDQKRDEERQTGHRKTSISPEAAPTAAVEKKPLSIAGVLAAFALIGAAIWYYLKGRRVA